MCPRWLSTRQTHPSQQQGERSTGKQGNSGKHDSAIQTADSLIDCANSIGPDERADIADG
jgi:hypothetical protein